MPLCFGLDRFHIYVCGKHIIVQNDRKPLEMIHRKPIHAAPPRLQHMLLRLLKYDYTLQYIPGKDMVLADRLSRLSLHKNNPIELHQNIQIIGFNPDCLNIIRGAIERDLVHSSVYRLTSNEWPDKMRDVPHLAHHLGYQSQVDN